MYYYKPGKLSKESDDADYTTGGRKAIWLYNNYLNLYNKKKKKKGEEKKIREIIINYTFIYTKNWKRKVFLDTMCYYWINTRGCS